MSPIFTVGQRLKIRRGNRSLWFKVVKFNPEAQTVIVSSRTVVAIYTVKYLLEVCNVSTR